MGCPRPRPCHRRRRFFVEMWQTRADAQNATGAIAAADGQSGYFGVAETLFLGGSVGHVIPAAAAAATTPALFVSEWL